MNRRTFDVEHGGVGVLGADAVLRDTLVLALVLLHAVSDLKSTCNKKLKVNITSLMTNTSLYIYKHLKV